MPNLEKAWRSLNKRPKSHGISNETIENFGKNLRTNLKQIRFSLRNNQYEFHDVLAVKIPKANNPSSFRPLRVYEIKDRVVIKAVVNIIEPILQRKLKLRNDASFAYQKGLGAEYVYKRIMGLYNKGFRTILEADIERFFDTVNQDNLLQKYVFPNLRDTSLNELIKTALCREIGNKNEFDEEELQVFGDSHNGIPQGSSLSPLLSNIYLSSFDKQMLKKKYGLVRYADDFVVMCRDRKQAEEAFNFAKGVLEEELELKIHPLGTPDSDAKTKIIFPSQNPLKFLSIRFDGKIIYPDKKKVNELKKNIRLITENRKISVKDLLVGVERRLRGWLAAFHFTDVDRYFIEIDKTINECLAINLYRKDWKLKELEVNSGKRFQLNEKQRKLSGIPTCQDIIEEIRKD